MAIPEKTELVDIIQLKNQLFKIAQQGQLSKADFDSMNRALDLLSYSLIEDVNEETLPDLFTQFQLKNPTFNFTPLKPIFRKQRFKALEQLRQQIFSSVADINQLTEIDASQIIYLNTPIPIKPFSWSEKHLQYQQILNELANEQLNFSTLHTKACNFFENQSIEKQLVGLPEFRNNIVRHLLQSNLITNENAIDYIHDEELVRSVLRDHETKIKQQFNQGLISTEHQHHGEKTLFNLLKNETISPRPQIPLAELILLWQGPNFYLLAQELFSKTVQEQQSFEIFYVRTGIEIEDNTTRLMQWSREGQIAEQQEYNQLIHLIEQNRLIYDALQVASLSHVNPTSENHKNRWLLIAQSLFQATKDQEKLSDVVIEKSKQEKQIINEETTKPLASKRLEEFEKNIAQEEIEDFATKDASLHVPKKPIKPDDAIINEHSNWNQYIKPFLSENWLGLIGIGFIVAAWPILSMMVWDKNEYYRIAAGAIPLLCLTVGFAWIAQFFTHFKSKYESKNNKNLTPRNKKPVQLFSGLTTLSIPFNILMAVSIYDSGLTLIACFMLLVYAGAIWFISPWLKSSYGNSPRSYLLLSHSILIIPTVLSSLQIDYLEPGLALMTYMAFFFLVKTIMAQLGNPNKENQSFLFLIVSIHLFISLIASHIFYVQLPEIGTVAVIMVLTAICLLYLHINTKKSLENSSQPHSQKISILIIGGATTVFGNLLALSEPTYLLVTLILSAIFWVGLSILFNKKKWPIEVLAFHCLAYVAALQYHLELNQIFLFILILLGGISIWLLETKLAKHEIKLLSFLIPIGLVLISLENNLSGIPGIISLIATLIIACFNYYRCSKLFQVGLWYISIGTLISILPIYYYETGTLSNLAIYISTITLIWAFISPKFTDIPAQLHRTSVLWIFSILSTLLLVYISVTSKLEWSAIWFSALILTLLANFIAAKRAQSLFPLYLSALLIGLAGFWIKHELHIISKSGLGSAAFALLLIYAAPRLQKLSFFETNKKPDRFFSRNFLLHSQQYIRLPLEHFSWILIAMSFVKTISLFTPAIENIKLSLACAVQVLSLILLSVRYQKSWITTLSFLPLLTLICTIILSFPYSYTPIFTISLLLAWHHLMQKCSQLSNELQIVFNPIVQVQTLISTLFIIAGILAYGYLILFDAKTWQFFVFGIMSLLYIETVFVRLKSVKFSHLNLLHISILWSLFYGLSFYSPAEPVSSLLAWYLIGLSALLFIPAYFMEWLTGSISKIYHPAIQTWLAILAIALITLFIADYYLGYSLDAVVLCLGIIVLHCTNRAFHHWSILVAKWLTCCLIAYNFIPNNIYAALIGAFIFSITEFIWHNFSKFRLLQVQGINEHNTTPTTNIAIIVALGVITTITIHFMSFIGFGVDTISSYWLFSLLPLTLYLYKTLQWSILSYTIALIFTYINIFIAIDWHINLSSLGLNYIHLICGSLIISILSLALIAKVIPSSTIKTSQEVL
ncbi:hypothetical protein [Aliikangiella sp. IMCC44359]|uniref:hypothetical protein n=1 Tax=Aliikangiella sp. IMCC44359 TaxID=3459125 RepID=UPI00403A7E57